MKYTRYRSHKINTGKDANTYESHDMGATVVFDTEVDTLPEGYTEDTLDTFLEEELDFLLAPAAKRVVKSGVIEDSHVYDYYKINRKKDTDGWQH